LIMCQEAKPAAIASTPSKKALTRFAPGRGKLLAAMWQGQYDLRLSPWPYHLGGLAAR